MAVERLADVGGRATLLVPQTLVLEDVEADPVHARHGGRGHPFVEVTETRPAEVRPDEVAEPQITGRFMSFARHRFWMR